MYFFVFLAVISVGVTWAFWLASKPDAEVSWSKNLDRH
jgi:hypothetical protein